MSRPQPDGLAAFQRQRSAERRNAVIAAIRKLDRGGESITVAAVASLAGVDRSYIYDQTDCSKASANDERRLSGRRRARQPSERRSSRCGLD